jgi:alcohol dehydrogenase (cytochrome c)
MSGRLYPYAPMTPVAALAICLASVAAGVPAQTVDSGRQEFLARCVGCHGEDGGGGARGIAIVNVRQPRAASRDAVRDLIRDGVPNGGMPAFPLSDAELDAMATYVLSLRAAAARTPATGESARLPRATPADREDGIPFVDVAHPKPGTWPTYHGQLNGNRFSPLDQINSGNVQQLAPRWMFTIHGAPRDLQVTPVVAGGVMYVTSVNEAFALDARSGREIWHYSRPRTPGLAGDAASGINRGVALLGDRVFMVTDNAHLIALHRHTGQLLWDVEMADARQNYGATSAPLVVNDLVISGVSGGDEGIRGFLDAHRAATGERVWRFWTVPAPGEPGSETWGGRAIAHGCAATWLTGTYDPESRLLYWPTGNPCPDYNGAERHGDNLYSDSVLALDPDTGTLRWHYQFTPHDLHDWDATETPVLVDAEFGGQRRELLLQGNRNGFFYVLDRRTGKLLLAKPFVANVTWASGIDPDGRPRLLPGSEPTVEGQRVCPSVEGAANWTSTAFSSLTGLFYLFAEESCSIYTKNDRWWEAGQSFYGGGTKRAPSGSASGKTLKAIDIQTGKTAWEIPDVGGGILGSGLMVTAGGLVFYGDGRGAFVAADATNGKLVWQFTTNERWKAGPMTYTVEGNQYIGVAAGTTILAFSLR